MRIDVLGVGFDNLTMTEAVSRGAALLEEPGCHYVVTPNPEIVEVCRENPTAMQAVNGADLVLPDGIGVVKGAAMLGTPLKEKTPGIEFAAGLMGKMAERGRSLYLLGAKPGVADMAAERLQKQYPGLKIAGTHDGYFKEDAPVVDAIRESGADCVFVCLGAPKQELWMARNGPATGTHADIHEQDETYLKNCRAAAREIVKDCGWTVIRCAKGDAPRTVEDIHSQVYETVKSLL